MFDQSCKTDCSPPSEGGGTGGGSYGGAGYDGGGGSGTGGFGDFYDQCPDDMLCY